MSGARQSVGLSDFASAVGRFRVICLGLSALDQVWRVDRLFAGHSEKIRASDFATVGGGMAANASVAISRLGAAASFWGRGGADPAGEQMRDALATEGVDVSQFKLFADGRSSVSGIIVDQTGERQIVNFRGRFPDAADWLPLDEVTQAQAVLADPRWPDGAVALFGQARALGIPTILDADMAEPDVFERLLPLTDHAVFSEPALTAFVGAADDAAIAKVARFGCKVTAVTRGEGGVSWFEAGHLHHAPAFTVDAVDTTGAGDVFHGAYTLAIGGGLSIRDAMAFASAAAALKCTREGGRAGIPTIHECLAFMRTKQ